jgi:hypothetical protein
MCMACDDQAMFFRAWLQDAAARGVMPEGVTAEDFTAFGLAMPAQLAAKQEPARNAFACDSPE